MTLTLTEIRAEAGEKQCAINFTRKDGMGTMNIMTSDALAKVALTYAQLGGIIQDCHRIRDDIDSNTGGGIDEVKD